MKTNRSSARVKNFFVALVAAGLAAGVASAQPPTVEGKFTLPMDVQWGGAMLSAGDYTFTLHSVGLPAKLIVRSKAKGSTGAIVFARGYNPASYSDDSSLAIVRRAGKPFVRSMHLSILGITFYYAPPKEARELLAQGPELIERVAVTSGSAAAK